MMEWEAKNIFLFLEEAAVLELMQGLSLAPESDNNSQ
jgi:hypothetical protein